MNAKPVKVGRKIIGWSCGVCGYVDCASRVVHGREKTRMEECCICATCKAPITTGGPSTQCGACRDKERTERESATTTERALDVWSWEDALKEHDAAWRFRLQSGTTGRVLLSPMYGGVFSGGYARLDPTEDDPDPRIASETLQRSEMRAVFDAVLTLTAHTDDLIESFVLEDRNGPALDSPEAMARALMWAMTDPRSAADHIALDVVREALADAGWTFRMVTSEDENWSLDVGPWGDARCVAISRNTTWHRESVIGAADALARDLCLSSMAQTRPIVLAQWLLASVGRASR